MEGLQVEYTNESAGDSVVRRKEELDESWRRKQTLREAEALKRQAERDEERDPSEDVDAFHTRFRYLAEQVESGLASAKAQFDAKDPQLDKAQLAQKMNALLAIVQQQMQKALSDASLYLPPYDVRHCSDKIAKLTLDIDQARTDLAPRKKFTFKRKERQQTKSTQETCSSTNVDGSSREGGAKVRAAEALLEKLKLDENETVFEEERDKVIHVELQRREQDVRFSNVENCTIVAKCQSGAIRFLGLRNCKVYCGPVAGSCFFERCVDCVFHIASRQIRIHDSTNCDFYLHVLSRPIIEHCSSLRFAPYLLSYSGLEDQLNVAGFAGDADCWKDVDDFRWLRQQQSPNWSILPPDERIHVNLDELLNSNKINP